MRGLRLRARFVPAGPLCSPRLPSRKAGTFVGVSPPPAPSIGAVPAVNSPWGTHPPCTLTSWLVFPKATPAHPAKSPSDSGREPCPGVVGQSWGLQSPCTPQTRAPGLCAPPAAPRGAGGLGTGAGGRAAQHQTGTFWDQRGGQRAGSWPGSGTRRCSPISLLALGVPTVSLPAPEAIARPGGARGFLPVPSDVPALVAVCRHRPGAGL